jgi:hypothetical protein
MLAAGAVLCGFGAREAQASMTVLSDAGNFSFTITGGGKPDSATITFTGVTLTTVNGSPISAITSSFADLSFSMTPGSSFVPASGTGTKTFGPTAGSQAILGYSLSSGLAPASGGFLNLKGTVTGVSSNSLSGFDFSPYGNGKGSITITLTKVGGDFAGLISSGSGTISGTGGFTENAAVAPEPSTIAIFGIGLAGFFAVRRLSRRTAVA